MVKRFTAAPVIHYGAVIFVVALSLVVENYTIMSLSHAVTHTHTPIRTVCHPSNSVNTLKSHYCSTAATPKFRSLSPSCGHRSAALLNRFGRKLSPPEQTQPVHRQRISSTSCVPVVSVMLANFELAVIDCKNSMPSSFTFYRASHILGLLSPMFVTANLHNVLHSAQKVQEAEPHLLPDNRGTPPTCMFDHAQETVGVAAQIDVFDACCNGFPRCVPHKIVVW